MCIMNLATLMFSPFDVENFKILMTDNKEIVWQGRKEDIVIRNQFTYFPHFIRQMLCNSDKQVVDFSKSK